MDRRSVQLVACVLRQEQGHQRDALVQQLPDFIRSAASAYRTVLGVAVVDASRLLGEALADVLALTGQSARNLQPLGLQGLNRIGKR